MSNIARAAGLTFMELMVALTLGVMTVAAMSHLYVLAENGQRVQSDINLLQENMRTVNRLLVHSIQQAGWMGCSVIAPDIAFNNHTALDISANNRVSVYAGSDKKQDSEGVTVWYAGNEEGLLAADMLQLSVLSTLSNVKISAGDFLLITDCQSTELVEVKQVMRMSNGEKKISLMQPLTKIFFKNAEIRKLEITSYFISNTGRMDARHHVVYGLFAKTIHHSKVELIENIDDMQVSGDEVEDDHVVQKNLAENSDASKLQGLLMTLHFTFPKNDYVYAALPHV